MGQQGFWDVEARQQKLEHKKRSWISTYCLEQGGHHAEPSHIRLMMDCTESCQTCSNFMLRGLDLHTHFCRACAEACDRCAQDCANMGDDAQMQACAEMCRRCAETCRSMSMTA